MTPKPRPPASRALAGRMAAGSKAEAAKSERAALDFGHRITLDLSTLLFSAIREACYRAGPPNLPMTCLIRSALKAWADVDPASPEGRRIIELAKVEAAAIRARK